MTVDLRLTITGTHLFIRVVVGRPRVDLLAHLAWQHLRYRVRKRQTQRISHVWASAALEALLDFVLRLEHALASSVVPDEQPTWLKFRVWLEAGQTPRFIFPNGPYESRASVITVNKRYKDDFQGRTD